MLSLETIQSIAEMYEELWKVDVESYMPLETMKWAYQQTCAGKDPWTGLAALAMPGMATREIDEPIWSANQSRNLNRKRSIPVVGRPFPLPPLNSSANAIMSPVLSGYTIPPTH